MAAPTTKTTGMDVMSGQKTGGGGRKYGRNAAYGIRYKAEGRRRKNKIRKLKRHMKAFPKDRQSAATLTGMT